MKYLLTVVFVSLDSLIFLGLSLYSQKQCCSPCVCKQPSVVRDMIDPYVEVDSADDQIIGAGTVLNWRGRVLVLTAGHVAEAYSHKYHLKKEDEDGHQFKVWDAKLLAIEYDDAGHDLALLEIPNPGSLVGAVFTGDVPLERGEDCWVVGTNGGLHATLEKTIINRPVFYSTGAEWGMEPFRDTARVMVNGNVWYGNSGGGLYVLSNGRYTLVGVIVELARRGEKAPSMAIPQEEIKKFLQESE